MNFNRVYKEVSKDTPIILVLFTAVCCEAEFFIFFHVLPLLVSQRFLFVFSISELFIRLVCYSLCGFSFCVDFGSILALNG